MAAKGVVKWHDRQFTREVRAEVRERIQEVILHIRDRARVNVSIPGPPHSQTGEFPRLIKGVLQAAMTARMDDRELKGYVFNTAPYAAWLEMRAGRSFLRRTLTEERAAIRGIIMRGGLSSKGNLRVK